MSLLEIRNILESLKNAVRANRSPGYILSRFSHDVGHLAQENQSREYLASFINLGYLAHLTDLYFTNMVRQKIAEKLGKYQTLPAIKKMLKAEVHMVDEDFFDDDYVMIFDKFRDSFTTIKNIETIESEELKRDYLDKMTDALFTVVSEASEEVSKDINEKLSAFFTDVLKNLKEPPADTLRIKLENFITKLHAETYGW